MERHVSFRVPLFQTGAAGLKLSEDLSFSAGICRIENGGGSLLKKHLFIFEIYHKIQAGCGIDGGGVLIPHRTGRESAAHTRGRGRNIKIPVLFPSLFEAGDGEEVHCMVWNEKCLLELTHHNMFENAEHRTRFRDLVNCYFTAPFFTKGLCKCMYLACWDEEHFVIMLEMLNGLTIAGEKDLSIMKEEGEVFERQAQGYEVEMYRLSNAFLNDRHYEPADLGVMDPEGAHIMRQAIKAAQYIDELPELSELKK